MNTRYLFAAILLGTGLATPAWAQHHHHSHHTPWHHNHVIVDPHGHHVVQHHDDYHYVIPSSQHDHGTYYTYNGTHYFYESAPVAVRPGVRVAEGPSVAIQPVALEFGSFSHVDELASRLESLANEFCLDLHYNYRHNAGFAETYGEAYQILQAAKYAHAKEHQADREALGRTLAQMDPWFHHVQGDVTGWSRHHHRQIGQLGIIDKMQQMESLIHHLLHDVGVHPEHDGGPEQAPPPGGGREEAPPPPGGAAPINTPPPGTLRP